MAENMLNSETRFDWSTWWGTGNIVYKYAVTEFTSSKVAMDMINYDMGSIGNTAGQTRLDVLRDNMLRALKTLNTSAVKTAIGVT